MEVKLTQLDGSLPNLALMRLAAYHRKQGDSLTLSRSPFRDLFEPEFGLVYGSAIFTRSGHLVDRFKTEFPGAIVGGTGTDSPGEIDDIDGGADEIDYSVYPRFKSSIGFTQRGCRLKCPFCVVPNKEGKNRDNLGVYDIWRGDPWPRELVLLDNDFFGQPDWEEKAKEIIKGKFKVNFNQGINARLIHEDGARYLAKMKYFDVRFEKRRLYTAWDNRRDEKTFFKGLKILTDAGIRPGNVMVYMLVGYWPGETMEEVLYRFERLRESGVMPYPMVFDETNRERKRFQRWVVRRLYQFVPWENYDA